MKTSTPVAVEETEKLLTDKLESHIESEISNNISRGHNNASDIGFECDTYQVLCRLKGELKPKISPSLKKLFRVGIEWERPNIRWLQDADLTVRDTADRRFEWKKYNIVGYMEADIKPRAFSSYLPLEHKTCSANSFRAIKKYKEQRISLTKADQLWLRKYPGQLMTYMLFKGIDFGVWFFFEKQSGQYLFWILPLDYDYTDSLIRRAERCEENVKAGMIPKPAYCEMCAQCPFALTYCFPDRDFGPGFELLDDESLEQKIKRMKELEGTEVKEFNSLKKLLIGNGDKPGLLYQKNAVVGNYIIESKEVEKKAFSVEASSYFRTSIKELKPSEDT